LVTGALSHKEVVDGLVKENLAYRVFENGSEIAKICGLEVNIEFSVGRKPSGQIGLQTASHGMEENFSNHL
jgi:hypothetical protein